MDNILIIEDDMSIAELEKDYLSNEGFSIEIETNGMTGLKKALTNEYDIIILDLMLPEMNGFLICTKLREKLEIPILVVSARQEDIDKVQSLKLGADDYITKPFSPKELVARVKAHLNRYRRFKTANHNQNPQILTLRGLKIDTLSHRVFLNDNEIVLTVKEFNILKLLCTNPEQVFTKKQIFDQIWGSYSYGDINTVTVHIRKLREKIEKTPSDPQYIETIWGVGYRFNL